MDAEPVPRTSKVKKSINQKIKDAKAKPGVIIEAKEAGLIKKSFAPSTTKTVASTTKTAATTNIGKKSASIATIRGSSARNDFDALTETVFSERPTAAAGAESVTQLTKLASQASILERESSIKHIETIRKIKAELDSKSNEIRVDEWLRLDKDSFNPNYVSTKRHFLRIINTLNYDEKIIEVQNFQTVNDLADFYETYNIKCRKYIWKDIWGHPLDMNKTLDENKLLDKSDIIDELGLDHFPTILLYFRDGFEDEPMVLDISLKNTPINSTLLAPPRNY